MRDGISREEKPASQGHPGAEKPRAGLFCCGGAMSSVGELTGVAALHQVFPQGIQVQKGRLLL